MFLYYIFYNNLLFLSHGTTINPPETSSGKSGKVGHFQTNENKIEHKLRVLLYKCILFAPTTLLSMGDNDKIQQINNHD